MKAKNRRGLMGLLGVLGVLVALNALVSPTDPTSPTDWRSPWPQLRSVAVSGLQVTGASSAVVVVRDAAGWRLGDASGPVADTRRVEQLVQSLVNLEVGPAIDSDDVAAFGLDAPRAVVQLTASDEVLVALDVGRPSPATAGAYVRTGGQIHVTKHPLPDSIAQTPGYFLTREVLRFAQSSISRIDLSTGSSPVVLQRAESGWTLLGQADGAVDDVQVQDFLADLADLRVEAVGPPDALPESTGHIELTTPMGVQRLKVWRLGGDWWAQGPLQDGQVQITPGLLRWWDRPAESWLLSRGVDAP